MASKFSVSAATAWALCATSNTKAGWPGTIWKRPGNSTSASPSRTAWAVMGLCAFDDPFNPALVRGVKHLIETQNPDGSWSEDEITGTGFPKVFYLKYDMYRNAWPLLALATLEPKPPRPACMSSKAWMSSSRVLITNGP